MASDSDGIALSSRDSEIAAANATSLINTVREDADELQETVNLPLMESSGATASEDFTTFHPFPRLATELRLAIWALTLEPRIIDLPPAPEPDYICAQKTHIKCHYWKALPPIALRVSKDSRNAIISKYPLISIKYPTGPETWQVRFNPNIDTLYLSWEATYSIGGDLSTVMHSDQVGSIQHIAIDWWWLRTWFNCKAFRDVCELEGPLETLKTLRTLEVVQYDVADPQQEGQMLLLEERIVKEKARRPEYGSVAAQNLKSHYKLESLQITDLYGIRASHLSKILKASP